MTKIFIHTQGCSHNYSDSEHMVGLLQQAGHELVQHESEADLVLFNTCTVKTPSENDFLHELKRTQQKNKKIIIAGCIPQADPTRFTEFSRIGTRQIDHVVEVVNETLSGNTISLLQRNGRPSLLTKSFRRNPLIETIPISIGCLSTCSFCKTKFARGTLSSYPKEEIIARAREATSQGVKEIWLTSQDTGCYGFDAGTNVAELLTELCKIEKEFMIRLGMGSPQHFIKIKDELVKAMKHPKVFKFLHIPVQSGNNDVLKAMKRDYTIEQFKDVVHAFRKEIPDITLSTDMICGFPGETEEQFQDTLKLLREIKPDVCNISRFWSRPGTAASQMGRQLTGGETKRRSTMLTKEFRGISLRRNQRWIGWCGNVVITEKGKYGAWVGRNYVYKPVVVKECVGFGDNVYMEVISATTYDLRGEVCHG